MVEVEDFLRESKQREKRHFCKHSDHIETNQVNLNTLFFTLHCYVHSTIYSCFFLEYFLCVLKMMWNVEYSNWGVENL